MDGGRCKAGAILFDCKSRQGWLLACAVMPLHELSSAKTLTHPSAQSSSSSQRFLGKLQPVVSRRPKKPEVDYDRGGSDFRTPQSTSSFGKQIVKQNSSKTLFGTSPRFRSRTSLGVGPNYAGVSSLSRQIVSHRRTPSAMVFGTSTREGSKKLYY